MRLRLFWHSLFYFYAKMAFWRNTWEMEGNREGYVSRLIGSMAKQGQNGKVWTGIMYHFSGGILGCKWYVQTAYSYDSSIKHPKKGCMSITFLGELLLTLCGYNTNSVWSISISKRRLPLGRTYSLYLRKTGKGLAVVLPWISITTVIISRATRWLMGRQKFCYCSAR